MGVESLLIVLLAWYSLVSALLPPCFVVYCGENDSRRKKKKIVLLLGNDRDATVEFFFFSLLHCSHSASSLEDRKTTKAEAKPHGALFMRGGVRRLCQRKKR